jgi:hypothetical protein
MIRAFDARNLARLSPRMADLHRQLAGVAGATLGYKPSYPHVRYVIGGMSE